MDNYDTDDNKSAILNKSLILLRFSYIYVSETSILYNEYSFYNLL